MLRTDEKPLGRKDGHERVHAIGSNAQPIQVHDCVTPRRFGKQFQVPLLKTPGSGG
jgi:hypothetical protein